MYIYVVLLSYVTSTHYYGFLLSIFRLADNWNEDIPHAHYHHHQKVIGKEEL